jgi:hypothetical protein
MVYGGKEPEEAVLRGPDADRQERRRRRRERRRADQEQQMAPVTSGKSIGTLNYANTNRGFTADELPAVSDPDATYADVVEGQYEQYIRNFRDFENALIASRDSTDLIDAAREDTPQQIALAEGIAKRNRERYGYRPTAVEAQEMQRATQRGGALTLAGGLNNARLAQRDANQRVLSDLINIGQGVNRSSLSGLGSAAQNAASRQQAFQNDRAAYKQQTAGFLGRIGSAVASFI